jgi:hypothetical protein
LRRQPQNVGTKQSFVLKLGNPNSYGRKEVFGCFKIKYFHICITLKDHNRKKHAMSFYEYTKYNHGVCTDKHLNILDA